MVPEDDYEIELGKAEVLKEGCDVTVVGWGSQIYTLETAILKAEKEHGIKCELIDLKTIQPIDEDSIIKSVNKTGRLVVAHEAPNTMGLGAEISSIVQQNCFLKLEAPVLRVCGWDTPFPLAFEKVYVPSMIRCYDAIKKVIEY